MTKTLLTDLLERNQAHTDGLNEDHFEDVQDGQEPAVVSMTCSDSRVSQEGMFAVEEPGWLFTPSTIGNQVWDRHEGTRVVDGSVLYPLVNTGTKIAAVVGHTGCGAVTAALDSVREGKTNHPEGIGKWVRELEPVIEAGLDDERVAPDRESTLVDQLVEYNVDQQIEFLRASETIPADVECYGFVYDLHGVYGGPKGRTYLVNVNGETDLTELRAQVPDRFQPFVHRLLGE